MATKTNLCTGCKKRFIVADMIIANVGKFCTDQCRRNYGIDKADKIIAKIRAKKDKEHALRKKVFYATDLKIRKAAAKKWCHAYIKARDLGSLCICCNKPLGKNYDSGHYLESGNNPKIRYDEDNIHSQRVHCNQHKGGNEVEYRVQLIKKIGIERVERLESLKGGTVKRTCDQYKGIEEYFKTKLKLITVGEIE